MEAFESFVALALEAEGYVVAGPVKFKIKRQTKKASYVEIQEHGYEVDLVAARADRLLLVSVKGFFGSDGVRALEVSGEAGAKSSGGYKMLNDLELRDAIIEKACDKYGFKPKQVELRLYGGKFKSGSKGEAQVREWANKQKAGSGPIGVYSAEGIASIVLERAKEKTYVDNQVLMAIKVLLATDKIKLEPEPTKPAKPSDKKPTDELSAVIARLPIGSTVISSNDGLVGVVLGHKHDLGAKPYVRLWVADEDKSYLRSASSLSIFDARRR